MWDSAGPADSALKVSAAAIQPTQKYKDPFDSDHDDAASSSEEELYRSSLAAPIEPTPISNSTVRAWPVVRSGGRPADTPPKTLDTMPGAEALSSSTSFERIEIPSSLKEGKLQSAGTNGEEVQRSVSVSAVASMFEAKAKGSTPGVSPNRGNSAPPSRSASGLSRTAPPRPPPKPTSLVSRPSI